MDVRINYSIVFVSDMQRSVAFYRDTLGIPLKFETPGWSEFETKGATLALHRAESIARETISGDSERAGECRAGFQVPDLEAFHERLMEQGVRCVREPEATFGTQIAQYRDPDGLVFSVSGRQRR